MAASPSTRTGGPRFLVSGLPARSLVPGSMEPIGSRRIVCSRAWSTAHPPAEDIVGLLEQAGPAAGSPTGDRSSSPDSQDSIDLDDLIKSLRSLMWRRMGITRDADGLKEAADQVDRWSRYILPLEFADPTGWTMQNMLIVARLMIASALEREESPGVHYRRDFPSRTPL